MSRVLHKTKQNGEIETIINIDISLKEFIEYFFDKVVFIDPKKGDINFIPKEMLDDVYTMQGEHIILRKKTEEEENIWQ